ncbi:MAG: multicopper oxidase domain-containing protein [Nitrospirae bacterium]|nr:multicopper oxidase domain-containing protein [Nitrospirota bacterium]
MSGRSRAMGILVGLVAVLWVGLPTAVWAFHAPPVVFNLEAKEGYISTPDGGQTYMWGFTALGGGFRYPGLTIDVKEGDHVQVNLTNSLPEPVSMVFFGQEGVTHQEPVYETVGSRLTLRSFAQEAAPNGGTVTYEFDAERPGTFYYQSGTHPEMQIDMGLIGGLIVRPPQYDPGTTKEAYYTSDSGYDREFLLILSAIDPVQHDRVERGEAYQASSYLAAYWFVNGRSFPDTVAPDGVSHLPAQPMSGLVWMHPGERVLLRMLVLDRDVHPFHHHGNHATVIAHNGRLLQSDPLSVNTADLAVDRFTQSIHAGETFDAIYTWRGHDLGWDVYGHADATTTPLATQESPTGHGEALPVKILDNTGTGTNPTDPALGLLYGEFYSGSPFLGQKGELPVTNTTFNSPQGEHYMMFHSHHETELQNFDEGPGGLLTQIQILPH